MMKILRKWWICCKVFSTIEMDRMSSSSKVVMFQLGRQIRYQAFTAKKLSYSIQLVKRLKSNI